jgi:two-component system cell cycle sensor histidine kinase/response regulator CckA
MTSPSSFEYSPIFERITDGFIVFDAEHRYVYFNKKIAEMMHMDLAHLTGRCIWEEYPDLVGGVLYQTMHRAMETQQYASSTGFYAPLKVWIEYYIYPSPDGMNILVRDVTDIKNAESRVARERHLSESIVSSLPGVFYLYDDTGRFIHWNKNFETITGYTGEEIARMHPLDFFDDENKAVIQEKIAEVFEKKIATVEAEFVTKDKRRIPFFYTGREISYEGKRCLIGIGIDISDRVKAEQGVSQWEKRFRHTLDYMLEGVQIFNADWMCLYANHTIADQGPYTVEQTVGKTLMENFPGIEQTELFGIFKECRDQRVSKHIEYNFTFPDGSTRWFELSIQPNTEGLFILSIDIDERKKAEEAIRKSEEKYRYLFNNSPAVIMIWNPRTLKVMEVNERVYELYGYTRDEYKEMSMLQYRPLRR